MTRGLTYQIAEFEIDPELLSIEYRGKVNRIEPRLMAVLVFLIEHQGNLVSREMLIDSVWQGAVVSDNAVNRTITKLRKLLGDSAADSQIIETIPKKGYLLKASVEIKQNRPHVESNLSKENQSSQAKPSKLAQTSSFFSKQILSASLAIIFLAVIVGQYIHSPDASKQANNFNNLQFETVTSREGVEAYPAYSKDGTRLAYSFNPPGSNTWSIIIRDLSTGREQTVVSSDALNINPAWSSNGEQLAFVRWNNINERNCSVHIVRVAPEISSERHLFDCGTRSLPHISWLNGESAFIYSDRESISLPYTLFKYRPDSAQKLQVTLPPQSELGHFWSEVSPTKNRLAILNYIDETQTELIILSSSEESPNQNKSFMVTDRILRAFWLNEKELLLYSSKGLKTIDLEGKISHFDNAMGSRLTQPAYSAVLQKISAVEIIREQNIWQVELPTKQNLNEGSQRNSGKKIISSSRIDFSPKFANKSNAIAFLSNRSGKLQLWLKEESGNERQLTNFEQGLSFSPIRWSHDDSKLLFKNNKSLFQIEIESLEVKKLLEEGVGAYNYDFAINNSDLIFTSKRSGEWQLWKTKLEESTRVAEDISNLAQLEQITSDGGYGPRQSKNGEWIYYTKFYQAGLWRIPSTGGEEEKISGEIGKINWLHWQLTEKGAYHIKVKGERPGIYFFDFGTLKSSLVLEKSPNQSNDFSISHSGKHLIFSKVDAENADIYQSKALK